MALSPKPYPLNPKSGFTLIEVVVYLALFAIMFGGAVAVAYNVIESSGRNQTKAIVQEEGDFLVAKINWALSGVSPTGIISPSTTTPSSTLQVTKYDGTSVVISLNGSNMQIQAPTTPYILNTSSYQLKVTNLVFTHTAGSGDGVNPEKADAKFTLTSLTPNGAQISEDFATTAYLRK